MFNLYDANRNILGTYRTHKGAMIAVAKRKEALYRTFDNRKDMRSNMVWEVSKVQDAE